MANRDNPWKESEIALLKNKANAGKRVDEITIEGRSKFAIRYKFYALGLRMILWKRSEVRLLRKEVQSGKRPEEAHIPNRSKLAKRSKAIRIGIWKTRKVIHKPWTRAEIRLLQHLVSWCNYNPKMMVANGFFKGRSTHSIAQQMRRSKLRPTKTCQR